MDIKTQIEKGLDHVADQVNAKFKQLQDEITELAQKQQGLTGTSAKKSAIAEAMKNEALAALRGHKSKSAIIPMDNVSIKALVGDTGSSTDDPFAVIAANHPAAIVGAARRRLTLLDVIARLPVGSNSFEFQQLASAYSNAAAIQAGETAALASQTMPTTPKVSSIATIGATLATSEQVLQDTPALSMFLDQQMKHSVASKLEAELIGGTGTIAGLSGQAVVYAQSSSEVGADAIGAAAAAMEGLGWQAGAVILNPADWQTLRAERAADGQYIAGSWNQPATPNIFGLQVISSASQTLGTALVVDPSQLLLLDRMQPSFEIGRSGDDFETVSYTCRGLVRAGLAVLAEDAVLSVAL